MLLMVTSVVRKIKKKMNHCGNRNLRRKLQKSIENFKKLQKDLRLIVSTCSLQRPCILPPLFFAIHEIQKLRKRNNVTAAVTIAPLPIHWLNWAHFLIRTGPASLQQSDIRRERMCVNGKESETVEGCLLSRLQSDAYYTVFGVQIWTSAVKGMSEASNIPGTNIRTYYCIIAKLDWFINNWKYSLTFFGVESIASQNSLNGSGGNICG